MVEPYNSRRMFVDKKYKIYSFLFSFPVTNQNARGLL